MRLLLTRPEPGASATMARLAALGHQVLSDPMLRIVPTGAALPDADFDALAFTSLNAVRTLANDDRAAKLFGVPAFAVGHRTAAEARGVGFRNVTDCAGDVGSLAHTLATHLPPGSRVLHAAGEDRAGNIGAAMAKWAILVEVCVLYRALPASHLSVEAQGALSAGRLEGVLHYSPRTAAALLAAVQQAGLMDALAKLRHFCLSEAVAAPLRASGLNALSAGRPEEAALLALLPAAAKAE
ncbi:uroporphyrinogen-III synthase [Aquabacter sp. L1I39]|uniref:uroporphyrinogen-III synthase n=1 Tax=Aquabacter sp. L1I39 TaxID=2820278 RepID=UPI001ADC6943|nr:uroporphyrinogen-III synthase [Aquabacter sp. L1I39]QTL03061.1 uroporphyrinogen-III synthase [Aquabacter sp. L1I39]